MATNAIHTDEHRYEAVRGRDPRFDGVFFIAVVTTGIYCRPSCPATTPKRENVRFFPSAAAAQSAGFRACRRCRPDAVPGSAEWNLRADVIGRAMRLINDGVIDREGVTGLAARLGYSERQVQRHLVAELGAGPLALARAQRAHTARVLLQTTRLPAADVAFAAGFASVRQFNDTIRDVYAATPTRLRESARKAERGSSGGPDGHGGGVGVPLRLAYREPYAREQIFDFIGARAVPGVEEMLGERGDRVYRRTLGFEHGPGIVEVRERPTGGAWLECRLDLTDLRGFTAAIGRVRRLFDLDADPQAVGEYFEADPLLGPLSAKVPGLRSPGAAEPNEMAVRAVLGQQITVTAARTLAGRLVAARGVPLAEPGGSTLTHLFPDCATLAEADFAELGMPESRKQTLRTVSTALADGSVRLDPGADRDQAQRELLALRGIGPWTAGYLRMRALSDPDVLLPGDVVIKAAVKRAGLSTAQTEAWHPWASYAIHYLWSFL